MLPALIYFTQVLDRSEEQGGGSGSSSSTVSDPGAQKVIKDAISSTFPKFSASISSVIDSRISDAKRNLSEEQGGIFVRYGVFRHCEILTLRVKDIIILENFKKINLIKSKNDQHRNGYTSVLARSRTPRCPVGITEKLFS